LGEAYRQTHFYNIEKKMVLGIQCVGISQWVKLYESNFNTFTVKIVNNKVFNQIFYLLYGIVALCSQQLLE